MTRILSSIFYISSMRKTSEEFNSDQVIKNTGFLCGETQLEELPYWETVNRYLKKLEPEKLQAVVCQLVRRLIRSRAFEEARIRGKYWQIILDGTQLESSRRKLDEKSLYRIHKKGTPEEYTEYYYYVLEAKVVLEGGILVSIMTEFVENEGTEAEKQDCERKACWRLMEKLKREFPRLPICVSADSLYACGTFFEKCKEKNWRYLLRYKEGSIPSIAEEYESIRKREGNRREERDAQGELVCWYDYVTGIEYQENKINLIEYGERTRKKAEKGFYYITDLAVTERNVKATVRSGRRRWKIENEGFNTQKRQGYHLEHMYSRNYQGMKNHYYLIQIGHMISQIIERWKGVWERIHQSREQKHRRILESWKEETLSDYKKELEERIQIRFA